MHAARVAVSIVLFSIALYQVEWVQVASLFRRVDVFWLGLHLVVLLFERLVFTYKWHVLLLVKELVIPFRSLLVITLIGKFWGLFLPSSVGVDIVRSYYLYRRTSSGVISASSVLIDKVMSLWALLLMGIFGLLFYGSAVQGVEIGVYLCSVLLVTGVLLYVFQREQIVTWWERYLPQLIGARLSDMILKVYRSFLEYQQYTATLWYSLALSFGLQLVRVLGVYMMALALHIDIPAIYYFVLIPISMILIMLPISIGGFGLREGIFVALFAVAGMSTTDAFALGFALSITDLFVSLLGGVVYWVERPTASGR